MSIYLRGDVWYYLFYVNGRRYRGSTKTKNRKQAERIEAKARVAAESGESLQPKRAPLIQDFAKQFLEWLDKTTLEQKTKNDYKNGRRLILQSALCGMRMDQITNWIKDESKHSEIDQEDRNNNVKNGIAR